MCVRVRASDLYINVWAYKTCELRFPEGRRPGTDGREIVSTDLQRRGGKEKEQKKKMVFAKSELNRGRNDGKPKSSE